MKMKILVILMLTLCTSVVFSQNDKPMRNAYRLTIAADETQQYGMDVKNTPYFVKEKVLQLFCGESVFVECEVQGDSISSMKVVEKNLNPKKTIVIEFIQESSDRKNIISLLNISNPFDKDLVYEASMYTPISPQWKSTSVLPIRATLQNFESWPHAIITLVLDKWHFK